MAFFFKNKNKFFNKIYLGTKMNRLIFFTKSPNLTNSKTRLKNFLTNKERLDLMVKLIKQNYELVKDENIDSVIIIMVKRQIFLL